MRNGISYFPLEPKNTPIKCATIPIPHPNKVPDIIAINPDRSVLVHQYANIPIFTTK
jgi:hypothetical protein